MNITVKQLRALIALAETQNFGRAAARVHVSQPALSVQIRDLERQLGASLVERQPRRALLTPLGHEVLARARRIMQDLAAIEATARRSAGLAGRLTLGVIPTVAPYLLPLALPQLRAANLSLDLRLREAMTDALLDDLAQGRLDAAIVALPLAQPGFDRIALFDDRFVLATSPQQARALSHRAPPTRPADLDLDRLLLLDEGHCLADQALEVCNLERSDRRLDLGASSLATLCRLVAGGFGMTLLPEIACRTETAAAPELRLTRFADPQPQRTVGLVWRAGGQRPDWIDALAAILRAAGRTLLAGQPVAAGASGGDISDQKKA